MWPYHPELLARPVPRYTSYPTAAEFGTGVGAQAQGEALDALPPGSGVSLYVHIPFCREICWYCGCNTGRSNRAHRLAAYLEALEAEIATVAARVRGRAVVRRIAFGGGSPNALPAVDFVRLADRLLVSFAADRPVISVELDPRGFAEDWARTMQAVGVTRASLGVQTFAPEIQARIGRVQPRETIDACVAGLRRAGVTSLNFDLMYGLPGQGMAELDASIDATLELRPERVALFGYAHVPDLLPRQRRIDATALPVVDERFAMAAHGYRRFVEAGFVPVGFDHFAAPQDPMAAAVENGTLRRNFQGFTDDECDVLIGLGASAVTVTPELIVQNEKNTGRYRMLATAGMLAGALGIRRDRTDRERAIVIEDILCRGDADLVRLPGEVLANPRLEAFRAAGLLRIDGTVLTLADDALPYARGIAACFDRYRDGATGRFSTAV